MEFPLITQPVPSFSGEEGCNAQHSYHQALHQGENFIPIDFILVGKSSQAETKIHQDLTIASGLSQAQALMRGKTYAEAYQELLAINYLTAEANYLAQHCTIPGNKPSNILFLDEISPKNLGALLALYEHKIFVQGIIWDINSFDQYGVELGKQLLPSILKHLQQDQHHEQIDCSTAGLIAHYKKMQRND